MLKHLWKIRQLVRKSMNKQEEILKKVLFSFHEMGAKQLICSCNLVRNYTSVEATVRFIKNLFNVSFINYLVFIEELISSLNGEGVLELYSSNMFCLVYV